jgi:hypothetical protein
MLSLDRTVWLVVVLHSRLRCADIAHTHCLRLPMSKIPTTIDEARQVLYLVCTTHHM